MLKTRKIVVSRFKTVTKECREEMEVLDREYYLEKAVEKAKQRGQLVIVTEGGLVADVINAPDNDYLLIDWDTIDGDGAMGEADFKREFVEEGDE